MMKRHIQILSILLILQIVLTAVVFWPRSGETSESAGVPLLDFSSDDIQQIVIEDGEGDTITLTRSEDGWVLPLADDYPAAAEKVGALIDSLLEIDTSRLIAQNESSQRRLKVAADEFERKIELASDTATLRTIYIGSSPSFNSAHVRLAGDTDIFLTNSIASHKANAYATAWIDTTYQSVAKEDMLTLQLQNANGNWEFEKDDDGNWTLVDLEADKELITSAMTTLETRAASIIMNEPLGLEEEAAYDLDDPLAILVIETEEKNITLKVGAYDEENGTYVVSSSESPYFVSVSEFSVEAMVNNMQEDFVRLLPTATPEAENEEVQPTDGEAATTEDNGAVEATPSLTPTATPE